MVLHIFLIVSSALNLGFGFLLQFKAYRLALRLTLLLLAAVFTAHLWVGYLVALTRFSGDWLLYTKLLLATASLANLGFLELTGQFFSPGDVARQPGWRRIAAMAPGWLGTLTTLLLLALPGQVVLAQGLAEDGALGQTAIRFVGSGILIPALQVLIACYTLYLLESTYRFARDYQRRIGRLCFIGLGCLGIFQVVQGSYCLMYSSLPEFYAEATSVVFGVGFPVVLAGFLRYRLGSERVTIPRGTIYTSATFFLIGAAFLGVALTIFVFRWLAIDFTYFERFLLGFTACILAILVLGSGTMRRRISRLVDQQLYSRKYDYQAQFFRLHKAGLAATDLDSSVIELVENMKYSVTVDDAHFFLLNWQDGNFYQYDNLEEGTRRGLILSGDSPMVRYLAQEKLPVDLLDRTPALQAGREAVLAEPMTAELQCDAVFPVVVGGQLGAILALRGGLTRPFDAEDLALIGVFTDAIGDALLKKRVIQESIAQKQFESFHHVASFIIHDIKNQIATLNLLMTNAERNLGNPSFRASMMSSIKSCAVNLQNLIDRLAVAPRHVEAALVRHPLMPLLQEAAANSGLSGIPDLAVEVAGPPGEVAALMNRQALFFVVRNLINNALEAMQGKGRLALSCGGLGGGEATPERLRGLFGGGERFFSSYGAFILVEDSGPGMDEDFMRNRLFQPFATTKEKGVGIGLYQCKTMVERMGGRILCHSVQGRGTEFCILLPSRDRGAAG